MIYLIRVIRIFYSLFLLCMRGDVPEKTEGTRHGDMSPH